MFFRPISLFCNHPVPLPLVLTGQSLGLEVEDHILAGVERIGTLGDHIGGNTLDGTLLFDPLQNPLENILVDPVGVEEGNNLLGRMLVAVNLLGVDLNTQVYVITLVFLMDGLVALCIGPLDYFSYLHVLDYPAVDIQQEGFALGGVQLGYHPLNFDLLYHLLGKVDEFVKRQLCY